MLSLEGRRDSFLTDSDEEASEGFPREGLDAWEATLETGDLRLLEGSLGCGWTGLRREPELDLGLRAGRTGEGRKPEVWERAEAHAVVMDGMRGEKTHAAAWDPGPCDEVAM